MGEPVYSLCVHAYDPLALLRGLLAEGSGQVPQEDRTLHSPLEVEATGASRDD